MERDRKLVVMDADQFLDFARDLLEEAAELAVRKAHEAYVRDNLRPYDAKVDGEELLTRKEAAKLLRVSLTTLDSMRRNGNLKETTYISCKPVFSRADLQTYIQKQKTGGPA